MPGWICIDRVDKAEIWGGNGSLLKPFNVCKDFTCARYSKLTRVYSLVTLFLYMVAELSALQQIVNAMTGLNGLPTVIVQCAVTTIYTCQSPL